MLRLILLLIILSHEIDGATYNSPEICTHLRNTDGQMVPRSDSLLLRCDDKSTRLFIAQLLYTNDPQGTCRLSMQQAATTTTTRQTKRDSGGTKCEALLTADLSAKCNGQVECKVPLRPLNFTNSGSYASTCHSFESKMVSIAYECIPSNFDDNNIPKYDICEVKQFELPTQGFLHSPHYPGRYSSYAYCQTSFTVSSMSRLEMYLIDMELESLSRINNNPTDILRIGDGKTIFGRQQYQVVYNQSENVVVTFKTDRFFNLRGFFLYFKIVNLVDLEEEDASAESVSISITTTSFTPHLPFNVTNIDLISLLLRTGNNKSFASITQAPLPLVSSSANYYTSNKTLLSLLIGLVILLTLVVFILLLLNRKSISKGLNIKKVIKRGDSQIFNHSNDPTLRVEYKARNANSDILHSLDQLMISHNSKQPRVVFSADDSTAHLLLNASTAFDCSRLTVANLSKSCLNDTEVYEDIEHQQQQQKKPPVPPSLSTLIHLKQQQQQNNQCFQLSEREYSDESTLQQIQEPAAPMCSSATTDSSSCCYNYSQYSGGKKKLMNGYCYIPSSKSTTTTTTTTSTDDTGSSSSSSSSCSGTSSSPSSSASSSSDGGGYHRHEEGKPSVEAEPLLTSTPSTAELETAPEESNGARKKLEAFYDVPSKAHTPNAYKEYNGGNNKSEEVTVVKANDEEKIYQIPSNLPASQSPSK